MEHTETFICEEIEALQFILEDLTTEFDRQPIELEIAELTAQLNNNK
jgi:hypothetical protein|tara:strand:- start:8173 stop:8313 length:141 start_codon:yes stop_codon:yes gene_type:complete